jgi:hypothetical protein
MSDAFTMLVSTARIDEPQALAAFLAAIPDSTELAELVGGKGLLNTRAYDDENQTARFVISDGTTVTCFTVRDITIDQAEMITLECEKSDAWSETAFPKAAVRALGQKRADCT